MRPFHFHETPQGQELQYFLVYLRKQKISGRWLKVWLCPKCKGKEYYD
jgi:hypothetical protein